MSLCRVFFTYTDFVFQSELLFIFCALIVRAVFKSLTWTILPEIKLRMICRTETKITQMPQRCWVVFVADTTRFQRPLERAQ